MAPMTPPVLPMGIDGLHRRRYQPGVDLGFRRLHRPRRRTDVRYG